MTPLNFVPITKAVRECAETWKCEREEAWEKLRPWLHSGRVDSTTIGSSGAFWASTDCWGDPKNDRAFETGVLLSEPLYGDSLISRKAFVAETDLRTLLRGALSAEPAEPSRPSLSGTAAPYKNVGGAPEKYDWDAIWLEICRIAFVEGLPARASIMRQRLQDWYSTTHNAQAPGDTILKKKLKALYVTLGREEDASR